MICWMLRRLLIKKINTKNLIKSQVPHPPYEKYFGNWVLKFQNFQYRDVVIA